MSWIASQRVVFIDRAGRRIPGAIVVGQPFVVDAEEARCVVGFEGYERTYELCGASTLHVLLLGIQFLGFRLHDVVSRGVRIVYPDEDVDMPLHTMFGVLLRAATMPEGDGDDDDIDARDAAVTLPVSKNWMAWEHVVFVDGAGRRTPGAITVGHPQAGRPEAGQPEARCAVALEGLEPSCAIPGESTLQALLLGIQFLGFELHHLISNGGRVMDPVEHADVHFMFGDLLRAPDPQPLDDSE